MKRLLDGIAVVIMLAAVIGITSIMIAASGFREILTIYAVAGVISWALIRTIDIVARRHR
jgi:hypothetical protein